MYYPQGLRVIESSNLLLLSEGESRMARLESLIAQMEDAAARWRGPCMHRMVLDDVHEFYPRRLR